jgi:hypothetical protein
VRIKLRPFTPTFSVQVIANEPDRIFPAEGLR